MYSYYYYTLDLIQFLHTTNINSNNRIHRTRSDASLMTVSQNSHVNRVIEMAKIIISIVEPIMY